VPHQDQSSRLQNHPEQLESAEWCTSQALIWAVIALAQGLLVDASWWHADRSGSGFQTDPRGVKLYSKNFTRVDIG
jgi:hypothetical protein